MAHFYGLNTLRQTWNNATSLSPHLPPVSINQFQTAGHKNVTGKKKHKTKSKTRPKSAGSLSGFYATISRASAQRPLPHHSLQHVGNKKHKLFSVVSPAQILIDKERFALVENERREAKSVCAAKFMKFLLHCFSLSPWGCKFVKSTKTPRKYRAGGICKATSWQLELHTCRIRNVLKIGKLYLPAAAAGPVGGLVSVNLLLLLLLLWTLYSELKVSMINRKKKKEKELRLACEQIP